MLYNKLESLLTSLEKLRNTQTPGNLLSYTTGNFALLSPFAVQYFMGRTVAFSYDPCQVFRCHSSECEVALDDPLIQK